MGTEVTISHTQEHLGKLKKKINSRVNKIINSLDDENNFIPKETILCNWCYLWEECTAKVGPNPVRRAE
jgi:CRISPR/Cas system CMR-associated protein Cmr1 (group 7 of RAMP superfamily)